MRPVVSSIVALAIAIAPFAAMAAPEKAATHKPVTAKVMKHHKKTAKVEKADKVDSAPIAKVKHDASKNPALKPVLHHAHNADVSGAGHKEPKIEKGVHVVPATLQSKIAPAAAPHGKLTHVSHTTKVDAKPAELPKLPSANAGKAPKGGSEKGAGVRKPSEKKNDDGADKDGETERDGEKADLVAPNRGKAEKSEKSDKAEVEPKGEPKADAKPEAKAGTKGESKARAAPSAPAPAKPAPCAKAPIEIIRGPEIDTFALTKCDGTLAPLAVEHLSVLVRPGGAARPVAPIAELAKKKGAELAAGVHRVDDRLAMRLQALADHFGKAGAPVKLSVVSGYRPTSVGSMHATGRAIDFRLEGAKNEDVVAFCKTLTDTGCGFYPNSSFVHLDVRDPGAGHVSWIDASGPGETPRYVSTWPPHVVSSAPEKLEPATAKEPLGKEEAPEPTDEHPAEAAR